MSILVTRVRLDATSSSRHFLEILKRRSFRNSRKYWRNIFLDTGSSQSYEQFTSYMLIHHNVCFQYSPVILNLRLQSYSWSFERVFLLLVVTPSLLNTWLYRRRFNNTIFYMLTCHHHLPRHQFWLLLNQRRLFMILKFPAFLLMTSKQRFTFRTDRRTLF